MVVLLDGLQYNLYLFILSSCKDLQYCFNAELNFFACLQ